MCRTDKMFRHFCQGFSSSWIFYPLVSKTDKTDHVLYLCFFFIYALPYFLGTVYGVWFFHILYFKISSSVTLLMKAFTHCWQPYGFSPLQMLLQLLEKVKTLQLLENYKVSCPYNSINVYPNLSIMWKYFFLISYIYNSYF